MSVYENIVQGLHEAIAYANGEDTGARENTMTVTHISDAETFGLSAKDVAAWFIGYNNAQEDTDLLTDLKLQKLLYYAQGIAIKYTGKTLFREPILAWQYGPVVNEVYQQYRRYGRNPIDADIDMPVFEDDVEVILQDVYDDYGQFASWKLVDMTHSESPWKDTNLNSVITIDKMRSFFAR